MDLLLELMIACYPQGGAPRSGVPSLTMNRHYSPCDVFPTSDSEPFDPCDVPLPEFSLMKLTMRA